MRYSHQVLLLAMAMGCGANCPETSNAVFAPTGDTDSELATEPSSDSAPAQPVVQSDDEGSPCGIPFGASMTEVTQRFGEPDATSEPQEVATEYHYYGKLLIIYRMKRVDDVILQEGGQCPE